MILSFAWTKNQFLAGIKTETRRNWSDRQLKLWQKAWDEGRLIHDAYNKVPYAGGWKIGFLKLTKRPYRQKLSEMTFENLKAEGGMCASLCEFYQLVGYPKEKQMTVIHFEKI